MRITAVLVISAAVTGWAGPGPSVSSGPRSSDAHLIICITFGADVLRLTGADKLAQMMLAGIGVETEWPQGWRSCSKHGDIDITLSYQTPASTMTGAFAYSLP